MIGINYLGKMKERLANQMFQYAAVKGIAKNRGFQYCIPPSNYGGIQDQWNEHQLIHTFDLKNLSPLQVQFMDEQRCQLVRPKSFSFDADLFNGCPDNVSLLGYFQSEKYFKNVRDELLEDFTFKNGLKEDCQEFIKEYDRPVALHIRRSDYAQYSHHPIQSLTYYAEALEYFDDDRTVFIFSDDPEWCKDQKLFEDDRFMVSANDHLTDLCMMSLCSDFIIANSSFSWWGAWLSGSDDVIAPKKWFGPQNENKSTRDLIPERWTLLDSE